MHVKSSLLLSYLLARVKLPQYIYYYLLPNEEEPTGSTEQQARFEIRHQATQGLFPIFPSLGLQQARRTVSVVQDCSRCAKFLLLPRWLGVVGFSV